MARTNKQHTPRAQGDSSKRRKIKELEGMLADNVVAIQTPLAKKTWTQHDMKLIQPRNDNQATMFKAFYDGMNVCAKGSAGTGKTFLALVMAMNAVLDPQQPQKRVIIVRSVVPTRDIGFLPGTAEEKVAVYEQPYKDIMQELFRRSSTYDDMKAAKLIEFTPTSFIRGLTWDDAIVVVDECQNMTDMELHSIMTRVGENTRVILAGDTRQNDLAGKRVSEQSGFETFLKVAERIPSIAFVHYTRNDIVRSDFVKEWIVAREELGLV